MEKMRRTFSLRVSLITVIFVGTAVATALFGYSWQQKRLDPDALAFDRAQIEKVKIYSSDLASICASYGYYPGIEDRYLSMRADGANGLIAQTYQPGDPVTRCVFRSFPAGQCVTVEIFYGIYNKNSEALGHGEYVQIFSERFRQFALNQWNYRFRQDCPKL